MKYVVSAMDVIRAVLAREVEKIADAVSAGSDIDLRDAMGRTALMHATIGQQTDAVALLLGLGADANLRDGNGWSALHFAAQESNSEIVSLLVKHSAVVDAIDNNGNTPLFRAVFSYRGQGKMIERLLSAGANVDCANFHGVSPKTLANTIASTDVRKYFSK